MLPKYHILFGFVFSYILILFFHFTLFSGIIIFLSSVLIDFDHYLIYAMKGKFNLIKNYKEHKTWTAKRESLSINERKKYKKQIFLFHGVETYLLFFILSFIHPLFLYIFLGIMLHIIVDLFELIYKKEPLCWKLSQLFVYITNKNKKNL